MKTMDGNDSGIALLVTLTILLVLMVLVTEISKRVENSVDSAAVLRDKFYLTDVANSLVNIGIAILMEDAKKGEGDSVQETWADKEAIDEILSAIGFGDAKVSLTITDELGKIQINSLVDYPEGKKFNEKQKQLWEKLLKFLNPPDESVDNLGLNSDIINCMKDWLDFGDEDATSGINGAENDYYSSLERPYQCGNGPLRDFKELLLIKNITEEMVNREEYGYRLRDLLTVYGMTSVEGSTKEGEYSFPGKININTAELPIIMALLPDDRSDLENSVTAQSIVDFRDERTEDGFVNTLSKGWYDSCPGCEDNGIDKELITDQSNTFAIKAVAEINKTVLEIKTVIRREEKKGEYTVLSWKIN